MFRTDSHNNPTAFTTDIARMALQENVDYVVGDPFNSGSVTLHTAKILGDPIAVTIKLIDKIGFYTLHGSTRWVYISIPKFVWNTLNHEQKRDVIGFMYKHEGGVTMRNLFPNYGQN